MRDFERKLPSWLFVAAQMILLGSLIFIDYHSKFDVRRFIALGTFCEILGIIGIGVSARGLGKSLTAMPVPKLGGELSTGGLYRFVRHPMYASVLLFSFGMALHSGYVFRYVVTGLLMILLYFKSVYEEKYLAQIYPEYLKYAGRTPRFIPLRIRRRK